MRERCAIGWSTKAGSWAEDLVYFEAKNAEHTESAWAQRVAPMLQFLFPPPK